MLFSSLKACIIFAIFSSIFVFTEAVVGGENRCKVATTHCNPAEPNDKKPSGGRNQGPTTTVDPELGQKNCESWCKVNPDQDNGITASCKLLDLADPDNDHPDPNYMVCECDYNNGSTAVSCWGDPHCTSADGNYWHPQPKVQMIAMENRHPTEQVPFFRLHTLHRPWSAYATLTREIQFEIFGLTINIHSIPPEPEPLAWMPVATVKVDGKELADEEFPFVHRAINGKFLEYVKVVRDGATVTVFTNVGLNFKLRHHYITLWIMGSELMENVRGYLGVGRRDGQRGNDFVYPNGTSIPVWNYDQVLSWASDLPENQGQGTLGKIEAPEEFTGCKGPGVAAMKQMCKPFLLKKNRLNPFHRCLKANPELFQNHFDTCKMEVCLGVTEAKSDNRKLLENIVCNYLEDIADDCGNLVPASWASGTFCDAVPRTNPGNSYGHVNKNNRG